MVRFHPELRLGRLIPPIHYGPRTTERANRGGRRVANAPDDLEVWDTVAPGRDGAPDAHVRVYRSRSVRTTTPALLWFHGGGMIMGSHHSSERSNIAFARALGITVVSVDYRLAPQHPAPAALQDCYTALRWMNEAAKELEIDPTRIAIGGESAGGGLAAGVALVAHDLGEFDVVFQVLVYPMLDDRTAVKERKHSVKGARQWTKKSNHYAWSSYLGASPGSDDVSHYAAPGRREDLTGLPPAWLGVGTLDLFYDEDLDYAYRLGQAGVPCETVIVDGAFHSFDETFANTQVSRDFLRSQVDALERALFPEQ